MIGSLSLMGVFGWFRRSLIAQVIAGVVAFGAAWQINNSLVARKTIKQVEQKAKSDGQTRNKKTSNIRRRIKRTGAWNRLRKEYARPR